MKVNCTSCGKEFKFHTTHCTLEGVDIIYAECPECGQRYISYVVDKEVKETFTKTKNVRKKMENQKLPYAKRNKAAKKLKKLTEENRRLMIQKKAEYQHLIHQVLDYDK